ncbi:MAG: ATP-binding protein [Oligoflexia bacterium]|nr:ATP-binding protein [Oligoflexia bacterium]
MEYPASPASSESRTMILLMSALFMLVAIAMAIKELPSVAEAEVTYYLVGRAAVLLGFLAHLLMALLHRSIRWYPLQIYLLGMGYCIHGQYFQPNYWLGFIELNALYIALFSVDRRQLPWLYGTSLVLFGVVFLSRSDRFVADGAMTEPMVVDVLAAVVITQLSCLILYSVLLRLRSETHRLNQRFTDLGRNFSFVLHDIKGLITSQVVYAKVLKNVGKPGSLTRKEAESLAYLAEDVESVQHFVAQINRLIRSELSDEVETTRVSQAIDLVKVLFRSKLAKISLRLTGDFELRIKPYLLNRILINAITNSVEEINRNKVIGGEINLTCSDKTLLIQDNSGTRLSSRMLESLNGPLLAESDKPSGGGMGTYIIKECVHLVGGKVHFSNEDSGVGVRVSFPKKVISWEPEKAPRAHQEAT